MAARSGRAQTFAAFADQFVAEGDTRLCAANKNQKRIARGFTVTDAMLGEFKALAQASKKFAIDEASFAKDDAFIRAMIHYDIDLALFGVEEARRNLVAKDPQAQFALQQFPDAVKLTELARAKVDRKRARSVGLWPHIWGCTLVLPHVIGAC